MVEFVLAFLPVLFNLYGPRAESDDLERIEFKLKFFKILQVKKKKKKGKLLSCIRRKFRLKFM